MILMHDMWTWKQTIQYNTDIMLSWSKSFFRNDTSKMKSFRIAEHDNWLLWKFMDTAGSEIWKHLKSGLFEGRISNGPVII